MAGMQHEDYLQFSFRFMCMSLCLRLLKIMLFRTKLPFIIVIMLDAPGMYRRSLQCFDNSFVSFVDFIESLHAV